MIKATILSTLTASAFASETCGLATSYSTRTRHYCIKLMDEQWDYAYNTATATEGEGKDGEGDDGKGNNDGSDLTSEYPYYSYYQLNRDPPKMDKSIMKGILHQFQYVEDVGCNWDAMIEPDPLHGFLGPVIRAVVGDTVKVYFYNDAETLYTNGVDDGDDDNVIQDNAVFNLYPTGMDTDGADGVTYQEEIKYKWTVNADSSPGRKKSTKLFSYISNANNSSYPAMDFNTGVFGPIVVVNPLYVVSNKEAADATPCDIDTEVFMGVVEQAEANSLYYKWNLHDQFNKKFHSKYRDQLENALGNTKRSINGHMYGNLNADLGMEFKYHTKVRWNVISFNTTQIEFECDDHCKEKREEQEENGEENYAGPETGMGTVTINWSEGNTLTARDGTKGVSFELGASAATTFDMETTKAGEYRFWVSDYDMLGMIATFSVYDDGSYVQGAQKASDEGGMSGGAIAMITIGCLVLVALSAALVVVVKRPGLVGLHTSQSVSLDDSTAGLALGQARSDDPSHQDAAHQKIVCSWCGDLHINGAQNCAQMLIWLKEHPEARNGAVRV